MKQHQIAFVVSDEKDVVCNWLQLHHCIVDRGSKYSVTAGRVTNNTELKAFVRRVKEDKKYAKATHNSYAARVVKDSQVFEVKNDDGETGAGMVILRQLQKQNIYNVCIVVTRWFGGTMLHGDRFTHVQDAVLQIIAETSLYEVKQKKLNNKKSRQESPSDV